MDSLEDADFSFKPYDEIVDEINSSPSKNRDAKRVKKNDLSSKPLLLVAEEEGEEEDIPLFERSLYLSREHSEDIFARYNTQIPQSFIHRMTLFEKNIDDNQVGETLDFRESIKGFLTRVNGIYDQQED